MQMKDTPIPSLDAIDAIHTRPQAMTRRLQHHTFHRALAGQNGGNSSLDEAKETVRRVQPLVVI